MNASRDYLSRIEIGSHTITIERNDLMHVVVRGSITTSDALNIRKVLWDHGAQHSDYNVIVVVTDMTGIDSGARQELVSTERRYPFRCYIVGASFTIRTILLGIYRARRLLRPNAFSLSMTMVATEQEARQMIEADKREESKR